MVVTPDRTIRQKRAGRKARGRAEVVAMLNIRRRDEGLTFQEAAVQAKQNITAVTGALGHFMQNEGQSLDEAVGSLRQLVEARGHLARTRKTRAGAEPSKRRESRMRLLTEIRGISEPVARIAASEGARALDDAGVARLLTLRDQRRRRTR